MSRSVFANNRNISHTGSGDKAVSSAPDVCKTPIGSSTPPIPYGISSQAGDLAQTTTSVLIDGNPAAIASSIHTQCTGDQAGSANGIISGTVASKTQFASYSFDVKIEGEGVVRHMDMTTMNNGNTIGMNYGAATSPVEIDVEEPPCALRFQVINELGQPVKGMIYKTPSAGNQDALHQEDGKTDGHGETFIVTTEENESMDFHFAWADLETDKNTDEG